MVAFDSSGNAALLTSATSFNVNISSAADGADVFLGVAFGQLSGTTSLTGWTKISTQATASAGMETWYRRKVTGDTTFTFGLASGKAVAAWVSYTGLDSITPYEPTNGATANRASSSVNSVTGAATPSEAGCWALGFFFSKTTTSANKVITFTPDAAMTERQDFNNNTAASAPWNGIEIADSNAAVTVASHSYTAVASFAESNGGGALIYLRPTSTTAFTGTAAFSGSGTATASGTPATSGTVATAGDGALTSTGTPKPSANAGISGDGGLIAAGIPAFSGTGSFSGSGALSAAGTPSPGTSVSFSAAGSLAATTATSFSGNATISGAGALIAAGVPVVTQSVSLSGDGSLVASGAIASQDFTGVANFSGVGGLSVAGSPATSTTAALASTGTLSAATTPIERGTAVFTGNGVLSIATQAVVRAHGQNTKHYAFNSGTGSDVRLVGFNVLDMGKTLSLINSLPTGTQALVWLGEQIPSAPDATWYSDIAPLLNHPSVFGFFLSDEPHYAQGGDASVAALRAKADYIRVSSGGTQYSVITLDAVEDYAAYTPSNSHVDIYGIDPYPYAYSRPDGDLTKISTAVANAVAAGIPASQIAPVFQVFGQANITVYAPFYEMPTAAQLRTLLAAWDAVVPNPPLDMSYTWGTQAVADPALVNDPTLQAVLTDRFNTGSDTVAFRGGGFLNTTGKVNLAGTAAFAGAGTLSVTGSIRATGTAAFTATGLFNVAAGPLYLGFASSTGSGSLVVTGSPTVLATADLVGLGTLATAAVGSSLGDAQLTGTGTLRATGKPKFVGTVGVTAGGVLVAIGVSPDDLVKWYDGNKEPVRMAGYWDGTTIHPVQLVGWWDGAQIRPLT